MWSKLSHALKSRTDVDNDSDNNPDVMSSVYQQHPNLSVFHPSSSSPSLLTDIPPPTNTTPPPSPSKSTHGRRGMFKRISKVVSTTDDDRAPLKLPIGIPKKVKSSLNLHLNGSQASLTRPSTETTRPSLDSPLDPKYSSVRSILRDPNTPGTGQNVRFFSRDAYKVISPDASLSTGDTPPQQMNIEAPLSFFDKLSAAQKGGKGRMSAKQIFGDAPTEEWMLEVPPPDLTNIFNMSREHELPPIPQDEDCAPLLDSAIEVEASEGGFTSTPLKPPLQEDEKAPELERSQSFSFGQTVFHSLARSSSSSGDTSASSFGSISKKNRGRALSDSMFQSLIRGSTSSGSSGLPEADINDESSRELVVYSTPARETEPDPFRANATTYYTPQTMIPPTPPQSQPKEHVRTASKEEDVIWSLRTQLAVQQELCAQYEVDLEARDELVSALHLRLDNAEKDGKERRGAVRAWRKKVGELEKACRTLEEEVDRSRVESVERSVMDEASGTALRELHRRIGGLEREVREGKEREGKLEESERALREGIREAKEEMERLGNVSFGGGGADEDELRQAVVEREQEVAEERERHRIVEFGWVEERAEMVTLLENVRREKEEALKELEGVRGEKGEMRVLKDELEAQWKFQEEANERIVGLVGEQDALAGERDVLASERDAVASERDVVASERDAVASERDRLAGEMEDMEARVHDMEVEWNESENRKNELEAELQDVWGAKEELEKDREEFEEQLKAEQDHAEDLTRALQEREDRVASLAQERQFALDRVSQLESTIQNLNAELSSSSERAGALEATAESLREEISTLKREHAREVSEQARALQDFAAREGEAHAHLEAAVREKAESDVRLAEMEEVRGEVERLRRVVAELKQESADKEVKLVQLNKGRAQDKEDLQGLNIALDSKQQELELLKRRLGVRGTAGSTPAQPSKVALHRRESSLFSTPGVPRPPSALSDVSAKEGSKDRKTETPVTARALGKSVRVNASAPASAVKPTSTQGLGSMGPPPTKTARPSMGTPTPGLSRVPSSLSRSVTASGNVVSPAPHRRASSSTMGGKDRVAPSPTPSEKREKENVGTPAAVKAARRTSVPVPA